MSGSKYTGFALVEMLVVIGILALLSSLMFPAVQLIRESTRKTHCQNRMRQIGLALHQFESSYQNLPSAISVDRANLRLHWQARLIPYLEESALYDEVKRELSPANPIHSHRHQLTTVEQLQCLSDPDSRLVIPVEVGSSFAFTDYCGVAGIAIDHESEGIFPNRLGSLSTNVRLADISDGLSNTLAFGERPPNGTGRGYGMWLGSEHTSAASIGVLENPVNFNELGSFDDCLDGPIGFRMGDRGEPCSALHHWSYHPGGANFSRGDSSVELINYSIDRDCLNRLATKSAGDIASQ